MDALSCVLFINTNYYYYVFLEELEELVSYNNVLVYIQFEVVVTFVLLLLLEL